MATVKVPTIFTAIDKVTAPMQKMGASVNAFANKAETAIARSNRAFNKLTPSLNNATKELLSFASTAAITAGILGTASFSVRAIKDYETALASTQAITGTTNEEFKLFKKQIELVATATKKSTVDIAKGFEIIGSAQPELLKSADALGKVTEATIILSKASRDDLETSALNLTGVMNQFGLTAEDATRTINVLSAGAVVGSASITNVGESMKNFGSVAAGANMSLEESVALVEVLGKFSVFGAEAGTKLRGSVLKLQQAGVGYASGQFQINDALIEARDRINKLSTAKEKDAALTKMFGAENIATGRILLSNIDLFNEYTKGVTGTSSATEMAAVNSNTFSVALEEMKNKWVNLLTSSDNATKGLETAKNTIVFLTDNMGLIVDIGSKVLLFFAAWKLAIFAAQGALMLYKGALLVVEAYHWAVALSAIGALAPILLLVAGIALVISLIMSVARNWTNIVEAFKSDGIIGGLKMIGATILDMILAPLQKILEIAGKIPGRVGELARTGAGKIEDLRASMGLEVGRSDAVVTPPINPKADEQNAMVERLESSTTKTTVVDFKNVPKGTQITGDDISAALPQLTSTFSMF